MDAVNHIILVDSDVRRRANISHELSRMGVHVEPFETVVELGRHWPSRGLILVHDTDDAVPELMQQMTAASSWLPLVGFAEKPAARQIVDAILAGAVDYIAWPFQDAELTTTLENAQARAQSFGGAKLREAAARSRIERLTRREREVLSGIASGHSNRLIAEHLAISPRTVEIHRANMLNKIGASHTSDAIRIAIEAAMPVETSH